MNAGAFKQPSTLLLTVLVRREVDIVAARQRARQIASLVGFSNQDQVRVATAVSEIARIGYQSGGIRVDFALALEQHPQALTITVIDEETAGFRSVLQGQQSGMDVALIATQRLMDNIEISSDASKGAIFSKNLPANGPRLNLSDVAFLGTQLTRDKPPATSESDLQSRDLIETLESLRLRDLELERRNAEMRRVNAELEETNRGVVALYAELEEKAGALRDAAELKGRFLRHVSHEFRTPLNSILALTQLLLRRTDGELTSEQERQVGYIRRAAQDLTEIVNDLLDLAKVEAGKTEVHISRIHLGQLFGALRGVMRPLVISEAVTLVVEDPLEDFSFESDESKIAQILRNLISNALKFTERGEVRVSSQVVGGCLVLSVTDTGIGIAPKDQEHIFQEFAQVDNAIQGRVKGTGLGLPLSRKLAALLGGELTVRSAPGQGSRFTLKIPLAGSSGNLSLEPNAAPDSILIIDDEDAARYIARHRFRGTRYRILEAPGGIEGAERARFERPALILLDVVMPDRSGFDVFEELKRDAATRGIPVIIHTSRQLSESDFERLASRHAAVLPKGESWPPEILSYIRNVLGEPDLFADQLVSG